MSSMSRRISLFSMILIGGMRMPSSNAVSAPGQKLPGVMPPMSYWWRQLVTQQNSSPSQNTGQISITSMLMRGADPGIVGEEHVAVADPRIVAAVLEDPFHLGVGDAGHVLHVRAEKDELGILGEDRRVEVERVHRHRRAGDALDGGAMLLVDVPEIVADDLERHRVDVLGGVAMQLELGRDLELLRRHIRVVDAVELGIGELADLGHSPPPVLPARSIMPNWVRFVILRIRRAVLPGAGKTLSARLRGERVRPELGEGARVRWVPDKGEVVRLIRTSPSRRCATGLSPLPPPSCGEGLHDGGFPSSISKLPKRSTRRVWPGWTTTVVSGVSTTVGPATALPGRSAAPS